jgi:glycerol-3-phosphate dehydrogenase (NAD+)
VQDLLAPDVAIIAASKGLEKHTGLMMSDLIPSALGRQQPAVFISGPSFAKEIVKNMPTALVAAAKVRSLAWCFTVCLRGCILFPGTL